MSNIVLEQKRVGRFTSSQIYKLMASPAVRKTYIGKKVQEIKLGRSISIEKFARSMDWGHFCERRVHNLLDLGYQSVGKITMEHPNPKLAPYWAGSPDSKNERLKISAEVKCYEPDNFSQTVDVMLEAEKGGIAVMRDKCPEEYWQSVSNAQLLGYTKASIIVYMPFESELQELSEAAENWDGPDQHRYRFISEAFQAGRFEELPYLPNGGYYNNLNVLTFDIPEHDRDAITNAVISGSHELKAARESFKPKKA